MAPAFARRSVRRRRRHGLVCAQALRRTLYAIPTRLSSGAGTCPGL